MRNERYRQDREELKELLTQYDNLREHDVKEALIGFRQALKDLGALK